MSPVRRSGSAARPQPEVLRGSLFTLRRRCGTPTCRCAEGQSVMTEPVEPVEPAAVEAFAASRELFETALGWLQGREAGGLEHSELEARLQADAREVFRQMFQDHLDLRATREQRIEALADADQVAHLR